MQPSEAEYDNHDLEVWDLYGDSDSDMLPPDSAALLAKNSSPTASQSTSAAIVPYEGPDSRVSHPTNDSTQNQSSSIPAANDFRLRVYAPVNFQAEMYPRITFLIGPSYNRNGHARYSYARIMGLEEAQNAETFRAGVFERLGEMGENVGSRRLVAKPDWTSLPFVVETDHDHHYLLETLKTWGEWKVPSLCVFHVSLEHEI